MVFVASGGFRSAAGPRRAAVAPPATLAEPSEGQWVKPGCSHAGEIILVSAVGRKRAEGSCDGARTPPPLPPSSLGLWGSDSVRPPSPRFPDAWFVGLPGIPAAEVARVEGLLGLQD